MESQFLNWLRRRLPASSRAPLGLSDDAAALTLPGGGSWIAASDMLTEGVHFRLDQCDPSRVGRKALAVNLSDLAAMAAQPHSAIVSLVVPRTTGLALAQRLYEGLLPLAKQYDVVIAGGDTNTWDGPTAINVTVLGQATGAGPLRRGGARPGDAVVVTGSFGGSILGRHLDFTPRVFEALQLHARWTLNAGMDVSDGLLRDLATVAEASHCGAEVELERVPIADDARRLAAQQADGLSPLDHALQDGEDFELILALPWPEAERLVGEQPLGVPLTIIGRFVERDGLWQTTEGQQRRLEPRGWEHA